MAKDVKVDEFKGLLKERGYIFKLNPESKSYTGTKNETASVLIFSDTDNNVKSAMFAINTAQNALLSQEAMLNAVVILPKLVENSEKASEFLENCFIEAETKPKQKTTIEDKNFTFYILGNLVVIAAGK